MWSTSWVGAVVASLIAVAGTLLGSSSTYWFQQKVAQRAEAASRQERLRAHRLVACSEFAAAVTDLRRGVIAVWFRKGRKDRQDRTGADKDHAVADYYAAQAEADRLGAVALSAKFRLFLLLDDPALRELADDAFRQIDVLLSAADKAEVEMLDARFDAHMAAFVATAANLLAVNDH
jgi:membrane protein YqaA with SNARE-associated domain